MGNRMSNFGLELENCNCCNLCNSKNYAILYKIEPFRVLKCQECGFVYANARPKNDQKNLESIYSEQYFAKKEYDVNYGYKDYIGSKKEYQLLFEQRIQYLESFKPKGKLLDIGCAVGFFMETAKKRGWDTYGVEVSKFASNYARQELGLNVYTGSLESAHYRENSFDAITMWDVLEHVCNPMGTVKEVHKILKNDGVVIISTLNFNSFLSKRNKDHWAELKLPEHLNYFNRKSLNFLMQKTSFYCLKITTMSVNSPKHHKVLVPLVWVYRHLKDFLDGYDSLTTVAIKKAQNV